MKQIAQGAEAIIYLSEQSKEDAKQLPNHAKGGTNRRRDLGGHLIIKKRIAKTYRHEKLDNQIRKSRTKSEAKLLTKATEIINTPTVINQDKFTIEMQFIDGERLSETLNSKSQEQQFQIMQQIGEQITKLHDNNIIHGDLTTSNTILEKNNKENNQKTQSRLGVPKSRGARLSAARRDPIISEPKARQNEQSSKVFLIDFGLGFISTRIEDKAVDLHLIRQALEAKHWKNHKSLFFQLLEAYQPKERNKILEQLKKVEARGRYKN